MAASSYWARRYDSAICCSNMSIFEHFAAVNSWIVPPCSVTWRSPCLSLTSVPFYCSTTSSDVKEVSKKNKWREIRRRAIKMHTATNTTFPLVVTLTFDFWPWKFISNVHLRDEYLCQVLFKSGQRVKRNIGVNGQRTAGQYTRIHIASAADFLKAEEK